VLCAGATLPRYAWLVSTFCKNHRLQLQEDDIMYDAQTALSNRRLNAVDRFRTATCPNRRDPHLG
jgi:hypothetical protein